MVTKAYPTMNVVYETGSLIEARDIAKAIRAAGWNANLVGAPGDIRIWADMPVAMVWDLADSMDASPVVEN